MKLARPLLYKRGELDGRRLAPSAGDLSSAEISMSDHSAAPSHPLDNGHNNFILFGTEWLDLQTYVARGLQLPIAVGDFTSKYGSFTETDENEITGCVLSMKAVQALSITFGNPEQLAALIASDGSYLTQPSAPAEIYGQIVWLASQIENGVGTLYMTLSSVHEIFDQVTDKAGRAAAIQEVLVGDGGLQSTADDLNTKTQGLIQTLDAFHIALEAANAGMAQYTADGSKLLGEAQSIIGALWADIKTLTDEENKAYDAWKKYTAMAIGAAVGITVISAGILAPVGAAVGGGLGAKAASELHQYHVCIQKIAADKAKLGPKSRLVADLKGLNAAMKPTQGAVKAFQGKLQTISQTWTDLSGQLSYVATHYTPDQLADKAFIIQELDIENASKKWQAIQKMAQQFVINGHVSWGNAPGWGNPVG